MKIVIAPDSFKGSLSAAEVASAMETGALRACPDALIKKIPIADGGEGTVAAYLSAIGGEIKKVTVTGATGGKIDSFYGVSGDVAIIEMAAASGLCTVPKNKRNPLETTTYGTGELIMDAVLSGCRKLIIGIGGSATNDGGMGMAQAIGVKFYDKVGHLLGFGGKQLENIFHIDTSGVSERFKKIEIRVACDVTNPLCGKSGASYVFGPQKGATAEMVERLDKGLANFAKVIKSHNGREILKMQGAGAAGGLGGGLCAFLDVELTPGIEIISEITGLREEINNADLVIVGEGSTDSQTAFGKAPVGVSRLAKEYGVPVVCASGSLGEDIDCLYNEGIRAAFSIISGVMTLEYAMTHAAALIEKTVENIVRLFRAGKR